MMACAFSMLKLEHQELREHKLNNALHLTTLLLNHTEADKI